MGNYFKINLHDLFAILKIIKKIIVFFKTTFLYIIYFLIVKLFTMFFIINICFKKNNFSIAKTIILMYNFNLYNFINICSKLKC